MDERTIDALMRKLPTTKYIWLGCFPADQLQESSRRPFLLVANHDPSHLPGTHWTAIYVGKRGEAEYFDSFAAPPPPLIADYLRKYEPVYANPVSLQASTETNCGHYSVLYCILKSFGFSMSKIVSHLSSVQNVDAYVYKLVNQLL